MSAPTTDTETPEETSRWRVNHIGGVLAHAGHPPYQQAHGAVTGDTVRRAGFLVQSRTTDPDCVYAEWIDHYMARGDNWRYETGRLARTLQEAGYTVEGPLKVPALGGFLRITQAAAIGASDG